MERERRREEIKIHMSIREIIVLKVVKK